MNHGVTSVAKNVNTATGTGRAMILTTVALVLFTAVLMMALEYPYSPANATSLTNVNRIDAMHNTHCDGDVCQTLTCINNHCQSLKSSSKSAPDLKSSSKSAPDLKSSSKSAPDLKSSSKSAPDLKSSSKSAPDLKSSSKSAPDLNFNYSLLPSMLAIPLIDVFGVIHSFFLNQSKYT